MGNPMYGSQQWRLQQQRDHVTEHYVFIKVPRPNGIISSKDLLVEVRTDCANITTICYTIYYWKQLPPDSFTADLCNLIEWNTFPDSGEIQCEIDSELLKGEAYGSYRTLSQMVVTKLLQNHMSVLHRYHDV